MSAQSFAVVLTQDPLVVEDIRTACSALGFRLFAVSSAFEAEKLVVDHRPRFVCAELNCLEGDGVGIDFVKSVRESLGNSCSIIGLQRNGQEKSAFLEKSGADAVYVLPLSFPQFAKDVQFYLDKQTENSNLIMNKDPQ